MLEILKPIKRNRIRQIAGKEFYILKRRIDWIFNKKKWATCSDAKIDGYSVYNHKSIILRPLKNVDTYLQENKRTNLQLAIKKLNGVIINPFETFSLWKLVGRPTKYKGYLKGLTLNQGKIDNGVGGGLCQLGNLLFWLFAHTPLTITERYRHGFDVFPDQNREVPFGAGATLSYNYIDLQAHNDSNNKFQLRLWMDDKYLHGELISQNRINVKYEIEERNHIIKQQIWGGYSRHNEIYKIEISPEGLKKESLLVENHAIMMYEPLLNAPIT
jgi:vancomycin resistance protein VanW